MISRRQFVRGCAIATAGSLVPSFAYTKTIVPASKLNKRSPESAVIIYYSQTGHTRIYAELIRETWEKAGLKADAVFIKKADKLGLKNYDIVAVGSPVQYLDAPINVLNWLSELPLLAGSGAASFVSYGGSGNGQERAVSNILKLLSERQMVALGMGMFGNMSAYPPTWSLGNSERILKYRDRPNEHTYERVRKFASDVLSAYAKGGITFETASGSIFSGKAMMVPNKLLVSHKLLEDKCVACGSCVRQCPAYAIDLASGRIDGSKCLLCFGCLNNCPVGAHSMKMFGKELYSFPEFLKRNDIKIAMP